MWGSFTSQQITDSAWNSAEKRNTKIEYPSPSIPNLS